MKLFKQSTLASGIALALFSIPAAQAANSDALEQRIRELEARLEKFEKATAVAPAPATTAQAAPEVEKLKTKINTLERKFEVEKEVNEANALKLPKFDAGPDGFRITSQDGKHQVRIRGAVQGDGRFYAEDHGGARTAGGTATSSGLPDQFQLKQARVWLEGKFFDNIYFKIMPDFAASDLLPDAYLDYAYQSFASLSVGKQKTPLSLERLQGDADGMFLERAAPTYLASNRDVGIMLHGEFAKPGYKAEYGGPVDFKNFISYQLGVFNGAGDNGKPGADGQTKFDDKEFDGRIWAHPFQHSGYDWLEGLGLGIAGSWAHPNAGTIGTNGLSGPSYPSNISQQTIFNASSLGAQGTHIRIYPQAYWYAGPFGFMGEYVLSQYHLNAAANKNFTANNSAWQTQFSYVLTGEDATFQGVKPIRNFNPSEGTWGALQLGIRFSHLDIDPTNFSIGGLSKTTNIRQSAAWAVGLNWFLTQNAIVRADYEETDFTGGAGSGVNVWDRPKEKIFGTRFQLAF